MNRVLSLLVLGCLVLGLSAAAFAERRVALVIGNGAYKTGPLKNPANDARDMAAALKSVGFEVILRENAGLRAMNEAIDQFWASLKKGGVGLFFFAGHGLQVAGENYLVPVDARVALEKDVQYECVNAGKVLGRMEDAGNGLNIVILDACRNNPFARSFRSDTRGLAKMDAPTGSLVAFATAPGDVAADGTGKNGLYTSHLLRVLRSPGLKIEDVLKQVRIGVAGESAQMGKRQTPWESSSLMGDFYFVGGGQASLAAPQASVSKAADLGAEKARLAAEVERLRREQEEMERLKAEKQRLENNRQKLEQAGQQALATPARPAAPLANVPESADQGEPVAVPLAGTTWLAQDVVGATVYEFLPTGVLKYSYNGSTFLNGTWRQSGSAVYMEMNNRYAERDAVIRGDSMSGTGHNTVGKTWTWTARRQ